MPLKSLTNEALLALIIGKRKTKESYEGRLAPLMIGEGDLPADPKLAASLELSRRLLREEMLKGPCLSSSVKTEEFLITTFIDQPYESFLCIFLDFHHHVLWIEELFRGSISRASVHPREVVRIALQWNAARCIFAHNHPTGNAEPSEEDIRITKILKKALEMIEVMTTDHVVVGWSSVVSMAERKLI